MSPEIRKNGELIADVPDDYGAYTDRDGKSLLVDSRQLDARGQVQRYIVEGPAVEGRRVVGLTLEGKGSSDSTKKGGDGQDPVIDIILHNRPIRLTTTERVLHERPRTLAGPNGDYYEKVRSTYRNPHWIRR